MQDSYNYVQKQACAQGPNINCRSCGVLITKFYIEVKQVNKGLRVLQKKKA